MTGPAGEQRTTGLPALAAAAVVGDLAEVRRLVARGAALDERDAHGYTALMHASSQGKLTVLRYLVGKGASLSHAAGNSGATAFIRACQNGHVACAVALVRVGVDVDTVDVLGNSGRDYAALNQNGRLLEAIESATVETTDEVAAAYSSELRTRARGIDVAAEEQDDDEDVEDARDALDADSLREELAAREEELVVQAARHAEELARKDEQILRLMAAAQQMALVAAGALPE